MPGTRAYLDLAGFRQRTLMPASFVDEIEARTAGWIDARCLLASAYIDSRLFKRYLCPFADPAPLAVLDWVVKLVTLDAWLKRGIASTDEEFQEYKSQAITTAAELKEAADAEKGLFDLPLRADTNADGTALGFTFGTSQQSPYAWADYQRCEGRAEDGGFIR